MVKLLTILEFQVICVEIRTSFIELRLQMMIEECSICRVADASLALPSALSATELSHMCAWSKSDLFQDIQRYNICFHKTGDSSDH